MALENKWNRVEPRPFIADGTANGIILLNDVQGFKVTQTIIVKSNTQPAIQLKILEVRENYLVVRGLDITNKWFDLTSFLVLDNATVEALEQNKDSVPGDSRAVDSLTYEPGPINARRVTLVDYLGKQYNTENALPTEETPESETVSDVLDITNVAIPLRVGAANLEGRRSITIQPKGGTIYIGYSALVTAGNNGTGFKLTSNSSVTLPKDENVTVYAIRNGGGTTKVFVEEAK